MKKNCVICGKEFIGHHLRKTCSLICYNIQHKAMIHNKNVRLYWTTHKIKYIKCKFCGKIARKNRRSVTCSKKCSNEYLFSLRKKYNNTQIKKEINKKYIEENREKVNKYHRAWQKTQIGLMHYRRKNGKRRWRLNRIIHNYTTQELLNKLESCHGICSFCKKYVGEDKLTLDHVIPISKAPEGFVYTINDIQFLCMPCNLSKGDRIVEVMNEIN